MHVFVLGISGRMLKCSVELARKKKCIYSQQILYHSALSPYWEWEGSGERNNLPLPGLEGVECGGVHFSECLNVISH